MVAGTAFACLALWFWYGIGMTHRAPISPRRNVTHTISLADRIQDVMTEARMILPGAQALLGFQFATFFMRRQIAPVCVREVQSGRHFPRTFC